ncbi:MAG TPA: hypothetical protein VGR62_07820 [Candidatus Binatia bacterium]|jgi:hypothetical protein|nr:hypothetical protein [Candidatus Binatia bacterium]
MTTSTMVWLALLPLALAQVGTAADAAPDAIGSKATAHWTDTTEKAAATPAQKEVLAAGAVATITGEVVEVSCFLQLGKRGDAHRACGAACIRHGQPAGIVDAAGTLTLLFVEEHDPRRDGTIDVREQLASLIARQVSATGMLTRTKDGHAALYVQGPDLVAATTPGGDTK